MPALASFPAVTLRSLRHAAIDFAALALAVFGVATGQTWAYYVFVGYTVLMLVMKAGALAARTKLMRPADAPPDALYHALYGATLVTLLAGQWWMLAAAWAAIWGLSVAVARR